jgi:dTDP-4-amino-4,6-dideoxygalactose transaminase
MTRINVTKTFLPPFEEYEEYLKQIWDSGQVTNQGPLLHEFQGEVETLLGVNNFHFISNGTIALQIALRALDIVEGEIITTPFSYVATTSSILWERCKPIFVDIEPETYCIDPKKIEAAITEKTKAIMAVHVFGNPCAVDEIDQIAKKHNIKVIYDGAHAFGVKIGGKSIFNYGDISTCSFHATKLLHTIEGGGIFAKDNSVSEKVELLKRFGHTHDEHFMPGINAKASEFQAAMGLVNLKHIEEIIDGRKRVTEKYNLLLNERFKKPKIIPGTTPNYAYYPVVLDSEKELRDIVTRLEAIDVFPRRYFYPSLNKLPYINNTERCPISEDIASRIICLPLYPDLEDREINNICEVLNK